MAERLTIARRGALRALANSEPAVREALLTVLRTCRPQSDISRLLPEVAERTGFLIPQTQEVLRALTNLYLSRIRSEAPALDYASEIANQWRAEERDSEKIAAPTVAVLRDFLAEALALDSTFGVVAKAFNVQITGRFTLCGEPLIATDLRPIFAEGKSLVPAAFVVLHTIELRYHDGESPRELNIGLVPGDLSALESVIARARQKEQALVSIAAKVEVPLLDTEEA